MKTAQKIIAFLIIVLPRLILADDLPDIYNQITDIYNPTMDDYRLIQEYLTNGERKYIDRLEEYTYRARNFKLIGNKPNELPQTGLIAVNSSEEEKENCVVLYTSFNFNYPKGLINLIDLISQSDFKGHILYHLGGWPNTKGGSLVLAHVPYAFKVAAFKEVQRLGYKRAFWLDVSVKPLVGLNEIFAMIKNIGYFVMGNNYKIGSVLHPEVANIFGLTSKEAFQIPNCFAAMIGLDFSNETGLEILNRWYQLAHNPMAFYSKRPEQFPFSIIIYQLGLSGSIIDHNQLAFRKNEVNSSSLFLIDLDYHAFLHSEPVDSTF